MHSEQWVIYDHPKDFPEHFVVRRWTIRLHYAIPTQSYNLATSLEDARKFIPAGLVRTLPTPDDDPVIMEVWI